MVDLRIKIQRITGFTVEQNGTNHNPKAGNNFLVISAAAGDINALDESNNNDVARPGGQPINAATKIKIELSEKDAKTAERLLVLRGLVAETNGTNPYPNALVNNEKGECNVIIRNVSDAVTTNTAGAGVDGLDWGKGNTKLYIGNKITLENIIIDSRVNTAGNACDLINNHADNDLSDWKQGLIDLEEVLAKGYNEYKNLSSITQTEIDDLKEFQKNPVANANDLGGDTDKKIKIKQTLYRLAVDGTNEDFHFAIDNRIRELEELVFWRDELGFSTIDDVLKANANGITIKGRWVDEASESNQAIIGSGDLGNDANKTTLKKDLSGGKYKGFSVSEEGQAEKNDTEIGNVIHDDVTTTNTQTNVNEYLFRKAFHPSTLHTKDNIDRFRQIWHGNGDSKEDFRGFW